MLILSIIFAICAVVNFIKLFNPELMAESFALFSYFLLSSLLCLFFHQITKKFQRMNADIKSLWDIAKDNGYKNPNEYQDKEKTNQDQCFDYFSEEDAEEYFLNLNIDEQDGE